MKLKIRQPKMSPTSCQVWLDDHEITHGLTGLEIEFGVHDATRATLRILIDDLDVDAETLSVLEAHVKQREEAGPESIEVATYGGGVRSYTV